MLSAGDQASRLFAGLLLSQGALAVITGDRAWGEVFCVQGMHDSDAKTDTYTIDVDPDAAKSEDIGWLAIGFGKSMDVSPTIILWPDGAGSFVLSQRNPNGYKPPVVPISLSRLATLAVDQTYSNSSANRAVFSLPAGSVSNEPTNLIWAFSNKHPGSNDPSSAIKIHSKTGYMTLALDSPVNEGSSTANTSPAAASATAKTGRPFEGRLGILLIHAICGGLACLFVIPAAVLVPRIARGFTRERWWFSVHAAANGVVGFLLVLVAFQVAVTQFHKNFQATHRACGLLMFIVMCLQVIFGIGVHWIKVKKHRFMTKSGRGWSNFTHMGLGVVCMGLGFATVWTGFDGWDYLSGAEPMSRWWRAGWMFVVSSWSIAYLGGLVVCLPRQLRAEREAREKTARVDKAMIRLQSLSRSDSSSSSQSGSGSFKSGLSPAVWPNQYMEDQEVPSAGGSTKAPSAGVLTVQDGPQCPSAVGHGARSPSLNSQYSRATRDVGTADTADVPRSLTGYGVVQHPHHIVGEASPVPSDRRGWSDEPLSPAREVVLGEHDSRVGAGGGHAWTGGHVRQRSNLNDWK